MAKDIYYVCSQCGEDFAKWQGKCSNCQTWNSLVEYKVDNRLPNQNKSEALKPQRLSEISNHTEKRLSTGSSEFDRALSGGLVAGSITLVGGDPGIGKSTLMLQIAHSVKDTLYISGEESPQQILLRAKRLKLDTKRINVLSETDSAKIVATVQKEKPRLVIIDSIQTMFDNNYPSTPGSLVQVRECSLVFQRLAKLNNVPIILVGHVTKDGTVAGPKILEHMVDTVCYIEGQNDQEMRIIRTTKHRFGSTNEIGLFAMTEKGMSSLTNPSAHFIEDRMLQVPGSALTAILDGNRPFIIEVQALTTKNNFNFSRRTASGFDSKRLELIIAILERRVGISLQDQDIFINIVGGINIKDPAIDLAIAITITSSFEQWTIPEKLCIFGELGLAGEVRNPLNASQRIKEIKRLGYQYLTPEQSLIKTIQKCKKAQRV